MMDGLSHFKSTLTIDSLKGMQSVRATFSLPKHTIDLLCAVSIQLGLKQKTIIDHLVKNKNMLIEVAEEVQAARPKTRKPLQKTSLSIQEI